MGHLFHTLLLGTVILAGCSGAPSVDVPRFRPDAIAASAIEMFDQDGDEILSATELEASPGLQAAIGQLDLDKDGSVSGDEIAARVQAWIDSSIGGLPVAALATYRGKPLVDVEIIFDPEPFMADLITTAKGITGFGGDAQINSESLPFGAQAGFYRVRIATPDQVPAKYNEQTTLGAEISDQSPGIMVGRFNFNLD